MDSFERKIEQYREELIKYAQQHGTVYGSSEYGFRQIEPEKIEEYETSEKKYNSAYMSNRPMPQEYDGSESVAVNSANIYEQSQRDLPRGNNQAYASYEDFLADNTKTGKLRVQAYASQQVFPISNAKITVTKDFEDGRHTFSDAYTDIDGVAENIVLPTKDKSLSLSAGGEIPFATYTVTVTHPNFTTQIYENVPIFDSIESMQPAAMLPLNGSDKAQFFREDEPNL